MEFQLPMPEEDLKKLRKIQVEMLLEIDRICKKNKINYSLSSGTLLGAVRHKGFIPWDDDMDVQMLRKDYSRFCEACKTDLDTTRFFWQTYKTDPEYRWYYGKMRRLGTEYLRKGQEAIKCFSGVSIDVFRFERAPESRRLGYLHKKVRKICTKMLWSVVGATQERNVWLRNLYSVIKYIPKQVPLYILELFAETLEKTNGAALVNTGFVSNAPRVNLNTPFRAIQKTWYHSYQEVEFEGYYFPAMKEYYEYLQYVYGDYMQLPPENERKFHPASKYSLDVDVELPPPAITKEN